MLGEGSAGLCAARTAKEFGESCVGDVCGFDGVLVIGMSVSEIRMVLVRMTSCERGTGEPREAADEM